MSASFDVHAQRRQFTALDQQHNNQPVYFFDGPGGAQVPNQVLNAMTSYLGRYNSNLGGSFFSSRETVNLVEQARTSAAALLNAESSNNIVFGANMTSLTFQLSRSLARTWRSGDEIIVTELDHFANVSSWQQAAKDRGAIVHTAPVCPKTYQLDLAKLSMLVSAKTKLIAITYASNAIGTNVDMPAVVEIAKSVGAKVYIDAVHYAPHSLPDVQQLGCDFLVCSAYKFFGPHLGIAYVADPWLEELQPYKVEPAPSQGPGRFETGTQSFEALAGLVSCVDYLGQHGDPKASLRQRLIESYEYYQAHETQLAQYFLESIESVEGCQVHGITNADSNLRTPTFALTFDFCRPSDMAQHLGEHNMCTWAGHFYAVALIERLGLSDQGGVLRVGFMHYNTKQEIDKLILAIQSYQSDVS